ncbi:unnamed protein product, partial [Dovyalis caffra]
LVNEGVVGHVRSFGVGRVSHDNRRGEIDGQPTTASFSFFSDHDSSYDKGREG